jgi:hypothetical protein
VEVPLQDDDGTGVGFGFGVDPARSEADVLCAPADRIPNPYVELYDAVRSGRRRDLSPRNGSTAQAAPSRNAPVDATAHPRCAAAQPAPAAAALAGGTVRRHRTVRAPTVT